MNDEENLKLLIGRTIDSIEIDKDEDSIKINYSNGCQYMYLTADSDCCLNTYWQSIEGKDALKDTPVTNTYLTDEVCTHPELDKDGSPQGDIYQAIVIETAKGRCQIEMRTENEQYYGLSFSVIVPGSTDWTRQDLYTMIHNGRPHKWEDFKEV